MEALLLNQCSDRLMWYNQFVGKVIPLVREDGSGFWSREPDGHLNVVRRDDATVVVVEEGVEYY